MIRAARLIPRLTLHPWSMADDHAEHDGWCIAVEWLGLQVQLALARLTRSFEWPDGDAPSGHPHSGTAEVAPSDVSENRPAEPRSGLSNPAEEGA